MSQDRGHRLLGATILHRPPLGVINLEFREGVTALYGKNGAGKSRLLAELSDLIRGETALSGEADLTRCLHVEVTDPVGAFGWAIHFAMTNRLRGDAILVSDSEAQDNDMVNMRQQLGWAGADEMIEEPFPIPLVRLTVMFLGAYLKMDAPSDGDNENGLATSIAEQAVFSIAPESGRGIGAWRVWISLRRDHPEIAHAWDFIRRWLPSSEVDPPVLATDEFHAVTGRVGRPVFGALVNWYRRNPDSPSWVPIPLVEVGRAIWTDEAIRLLAGTEIDLEKETLKIVRASGHLIDAVHEDDFILTNEARKRIRALQNRANVMLQSLLADAPDLRCDVSHPEDWFEDRPLYWRAQDVWSGAWVSLNELSTAQRRWAELAISATLGETHDYVEQTVTILDEPERALHVAAVDHMLGGLKKLALTTDSPVLIATHAAAVLNDMGVHLVHVHRNAEGAAEGSPLDDPLSLDLDELGITRADLLQIYRVVLLVEGQHDMAALEEFVGDELRRARALIVPLRGVKSLKAGDAHLILEYTTASIVLLLDNVRTGRMSQAWMNAKEEFQARGLGSAKQALRKGLRGDDTPEERAMAEFMERALARDESDRIEIVGLPVPDVVDLLPVGFFVPAATSWSDLRTDWGSAASGATFKKWLSETHGATVSVKTVRQAAASAEGVPEPIQEAAEKCNVAALLSWMRAAPRDE